MEPKKSLSKRIFPIVIGLSIGVSIALLVQYIFFSEPTYEQELKRAAKEITKSCPLMVDEETRLDRVEIPGGNTINYVYTLVKKSKATTDVDDLKSHLIEVVIEDVKTNPQLAINREHNTTLIYSYFDKEREHLFDIKVTPEVYNAKHE